MKRFFPKLTVKTKLALLSAATALLLAALLYLQGWPSLTPTGALRRLEREYLSPAGEVVAQGAITWPEGTYRSERGTHWLLARGDDGAYSVAVLERLLGVLWRDASYPGGYHRPAEYPQSSQPLYQISLAFDTINTPQFQLFGWFHSLLVFSGDEAVTRITVTEAALSTEESYDPVSYIEANGSTADCVQVYPGVWQGELTFPQVRLAEGGGSSAPWTILRGYGADGALLYEILPEARVKE